MRNHANACCVHECQASTFKSAQVCTAENLSISNVGWIHTCFFIGSHCAWTIRARLHQVLPFHTWFGDPDHNRIRKLSPVSVVHFWLSRKNVFLRVNQSSNLLLCKEEHNKCEPLCGRWIFSPITIGWFQKVFDFPWIFRQSLGPGRDFWSSLNSGSHKKKKFAVVFVTASDATDLIWFTDCVVFPR